MPFSLPPKTICVAVRKDLGASNILGALHVFGELLCLTLAIFLANSGSLVLWILAQIIFSLVFWHAFILLHESGHNNLFRHRAFNTITGYWVGFLALIPFVAWRKVHARHHRYTGWQDLDATTASLVPRHLKNWERRVINGAWLTCFPLFAVLYRLQNFWNVKRLARFLQDVKVRRAISLHICWQLAAYLACVMWLGLLPMLKTFGVGLVLSLIMQEIFILSQHTHLPQFLSEGREVKPFSAAEQTQFTRSLRLPAILSWLLLHNDAHGLHHQYPAIPGYRLSALLDETPHSVNWWPWLRAVKRLQGSEFLFKNQNSTDMKL